MTDLRNLLVIGQKENSKLKSAFFWPITQSSNDDTVCPRISVPNFKER